MYPGSVGISCTTSCAARAYTRTHVPFTSSHLLPFWTQVPMALKPFPLTLDGRAGVNIAKRPLTIMAKTSEARMSHNCYLVVLVCILGRLVYHVLPSVLLVLTCVNTFPSRAAACCHFGLKPPRHSLFDATACGPTRALCATVARPRWHWAWAAWTGSTPATD